MPAEFHKDPPSHYSVVYKLGENVNLALSGAFLLDFFNFFFVTYDLFSFPQFVFFLFYSTITWLSFFQIQVFKSIDR